MIYTITLNRVNDYNLSVEYGNEFFTMSDEDKAIVLEDCINTLKAELLLIQQS